MLDGRPEGDKDGDRDYLCTLRAREYCVLQNYSRYLMSRFGNRLSIGTLRRYHYYVSINMDLFQDRI